MRKFFRKVGNIIGDAGKFVADNTLSIFGMQDVIGDDAYKTGAFRTASRITNPLNQVVGTIGATALGGPMAGVAMSGLQGQLGTATAKTPGQLVAAPVMQNIQQPMSYTPTFKYGGNMRKRYQSRGDINSQLRRTINTDDPLTRGNQLVDLLTSIPLGGTTIGTVRNVDETKLKPYKPKFAGSGELGGASGQFIDYNVGQSHTGPDEGIPVDAQGQPSAMSGGEPVALTEKGEVTYNGYVFSDETKLPGNKKRTFSDEAKRIKNKYKFYLGDKLDKKDNISQTAIARELEKLMMLQETVKGNTIRKEDAEAMMVEQQAMMQQQQQQPQQGGSPEEQAMMEEQMMAQQGMPMMKSGGDLRSLPRGNATMKDVEYYAKKYPQEMQMGEIVEYEHTGNKDLARRIAADHIKDFEKMHGGPGYYQALKDFQITDELKYGGSINIKPSKRGTFTTAAKRRGMDVQEFADKVMSNKDNYSPTMVKKANFARNAAKWNKKQIGGELFPTDGTITEQQQFLANAGFSPGNIDGDWGAKTQLAWNDYINSIAGSRMQNIDPTMGSRAQRQSFVDQMYYLSPIDSVQTTKGLAPKSDALAGANWQAYSGDISPWSMAPAIVGNLIGLAANKRPKNINLGRIVPEEINLESQRVAARNRAAGARATTSRRLRDTGLNPGAYLSNMQTTSSDIERNLGEQMSQSYLTEQTTNAQARQQAQATNLQLAGQETMFNRQASDMHRQQQLGYLGNIINVPNQYLSELQRSRRDAAFLNMISPDYLYQEQISPYSAIDPRNLFRKPKYRTIPNQILRT